MWANRREVANKFLNNTVSHLSPALQRCQRPADVLECGFLSTAIP